MLELTFENVVKRFYKHLYIPFTFANRYVSVVKKVVNESGRCKSTWVREGIKQGPERGAPDRRIKRAWRSRQRHVYRPGEWEVV